MLAVHGIDLPPRPATAGAMQRLWDNMYAADASRGETQHPLRNDVKALLKEERVSEIMHFVTLLTCGEDPAEERDAREEEKKEETETGGRAPLRCEEPVAISSPQPELPAALAVESKAELTKARKSPIAKYAKPFAALQGRRGAALRSHHSTKAACTNAPARTRSGRKVVPSRDAAVGVERRRWWQAFREVFLHL